jgi:transposase
MTPYNRLTRSNLLITNKQQVMKLHNPDAAGIDISSKEHYVAVPADRCKRPVRRFSSYTEDLYNLAKWLKECKIKTVAMESTGIYWYHLFTILEATGIDVYLVNAHKVKNVPGRKSDISDCQWLQQLHSYGLLSNSFQPDELTRMLRNYVRQRKTIIKELSTSIQRMQKALELMNIKLNNVISDITGQSGMRMIKAIIEGERNTEVLAGFADPRVKASKAIIRKSLRGTWREDQLFNLQLAYNHFLFLKGQIQECDQKSEELIKRFDKENELDKQLPKDKPSKNQPGFNVRQHLYESLGVDVMKIYGIKGTVALTVFSETGPNLKEKFPTEKQFLSWLNVVPNNKITGGKVISSRVKPKKNKAGQAFREAANSLWRAQNPIGDYLRKKKAGRGSSQAIVATARKLASIYYKMVTEKVEFDVKILKTHTQKTLDIYCKNLEKKLFKLKFQLNYNVISQEQVI